MTITNAEHELATALADLFDWNDRPLESFPPYPYGKKLEYPRPLSVYPPVEKWNIHAAARLSAMYLCEYARTANRTWASLPVRVRRRIEIEAVLIRFERVVADIERIAGVVTNRGVI